MKHLLSSITLLLSITLAYGQVPNTFSSGETISSSKINANFSFLANAMAGGNVEAMMHCFEGPYIVDQDDLERYYNYVFTSPTVSYGLCISTDNTSIIPTARGCTASSFDYITKKCRWEGSHAGRNAIILLHSLFENGWLLYSSMAAHHVFYKVSSD